MLKKIILLLGYTVLFGLTFVGCSNKDVTHYKYTYSGENDRWDARYKVKETVTFTEVDNTLDAETVAKGELVVTYKGKLADLASVRHLEISYESNAEGGKWVQDYNDDISISSKKFTLYSGGKNCALHNENEIITVTINLDGDTQTIELKNK